MVKLSSCAAPSAAGVGRLERTLSRCVVTPTLTAVVHRVEDRCAALGRIEQRLAQGRAARARGLLPVIAPLSATTIAPVGLDQIRLSPR